MKSATPVIFLLIVLVAAAFVSAEERCKKTADCQRSHHCSRVGSSLVCRQHCTICRVCSGSSSRRGADPDSDGGSYFEYSSSGGSSSCASCSSEFTCDPDGTCKKPAPCDVDI